MRSWSLNQLVTYSSGMCLKLYKRLCQAPRPGLAKAGWAGARVKGGCRGSSEGGGPAVQGGMARTAASSHDRLGSLSAGRDNSRAQLRGAKA